MIKKLIGVVSTMFVFISVFMGAEDVLIKTLRFGQDTVTGAIAFAAGVAAAFFFYQGYMGWFGIRDSEEK